ncbi:MAG TPA: DNA mismatch repair protein MutS [Microscillaceae bacterium]|nr:DNA mismatch repair protein MutS [Microscillaceae bacterium]
MNIGDRVRMLHGTEEGIISKINGNIVDVEIEDGFSIPVLKNEIVVIAKEEKKRFGDYKEENTGRFAARPDTQTDKTVYATKGIYVAFAPINDQSYTMHIINNTDFDLPFTVGLERNQNHQGVYAGLLRGRDSIKINEVNIKDFDNWGVYIFQFLFAKRGYFSIRAPFIKKMRFRASNFFKSKAKAPVLEKEAHLFQLDKDMPEQILNTQQIEAVADVATPVEKPEAKPLDASKLKEQMLSKNEPNTTTKAQATTTVTTPEYEVDLHIEKLSTDFSNLNSGEMLDLQLKTFENKLENAIASGMHEIIFIHGVGNGVLRTEIHKRLSKNPDIQFYEDARKEKFGYGATAVTFK